MSPFAFCRRACLCRQAVFLAGARLVLMTAVYLVSLTGVHSVFLTGEAPEFWTEVARKLAVVPRQTDGHGPY